MTYRGIFELQKESKFSTSNMSPFIQSHSNPFYWCWLGAEAEGVEGFFKGIGKGLLGLLVHPTGGVVDMVSFTLDGVRRLNFLYFNLVSQIPDIQTGHGATRKHVAFQTELVISSANNR